MRASVHFLNVGWGDAHFIRLPSGALTLMDGGDEPLPAACENPATYMERQEVGELEWMLLTHLHDDHLNGLLQVAKRQKVLRTVLPYEPFKLPAIPEQRLEEDPQLAQAYSLLVRYLELIQQLQRSGTQILWRQQFGSQEEGQYIIWSEEGFTLEHLYPWAEDPLPAYEQLEQALQVWESSEEEAYERLRSFLAQSNHDSSIYRLIAVSTDDPDSEKEIVLFGGDQLEPGWQRLAARTELQSHIWKASHHGMRDGVNERILQWIQPTHTVMPISTERAESEGLSAYWEELKERGLLGQFHLTGAVQEGSDAKIDDGVRIEVWIRGKSNQGSSVS